MIRVRELNSIEEIEPLRASWHGLLAQTPEASFFQTPDWLEVYWRHFGAGQTLRVLAVEDGSELVGIVPLAVNREPTRAGMVRVLNYPLNDWGDTYGPISAEPESVLAAALAHVGRTRRDWDVLELRWFSGPEQIEAGRRAFQSAGMPACLTRWYHTAIVELTGTWDQYLAARDSKWRNNLGRAERRLHERGELGYLRFRPRGEAFGDGEPRWDLYDACERLAQRSWQGSSDTGTTLSHAEVRPFLRDAHAAAARLGAVDLNLVTLDGQPAAFAYNYYWQGRLFGLRAGYDAQVAREGAGNYLFMCSIRDSFARGDRLHDMGPGELPAKRRFSNRLITISRLSHFARSSPKAQLVRLKRWAQSEIDWLAPDGPSLSAR